MMMATEEFIDTTIATMKIIGMVPKNGKLCVRKGQLCLDNTVQGQALLRWINGDCRDTTLMHAKNTITNAIKINRAIMAAAAKESPSSSVAWEWTLRRMLSELEACESGLQNLKTTYADDSMIIANLDVIIERQTAHQDELRRFLNISSSPPPPPPFFEAIVGIGNNKESQAHATTEQKTQQKQQPKFNN